MPNLTRLFLPCTAALVAVLILSGCGLIDRGVFWALTGESPAGAAEKDAEASARTLTRPDGPILGSEEGRVPDRAKGRDGLGAPLLVIPFDQPRADYQQALSDVVGRILARDSEAIFELVAVTSGAPGPERAESASGESRHAAEGVLITLIAAGLSADQVGLSARSDPEVARSELRLYRRGPGRPRGPARTVPPGGAGESNHNMLWERGEQPQNFVDGATSQLVGGARRCMDAGLNVNPDAQGPARLPYPKKG